MPYPHYTRSERFADAAVHVTGITSGIVGIVVLTVIAIPRIDMADRASISLYAVGLITMLICSAVYNMTGEGMTKELFRRLDHAGIFLMIAGSYTPFAVISIGGNLGTSLLVFVWSIAIIGIILKLIYPTRWHGLFIAIYLLLGWSIVVAIGPLLETMSTSGFMLLLAGGILYSVGVIFHTWTNLPYQNAIWHVFVLVAASCHFMAVWTEFTLAYPMSG